MVPRPRDALLQDQPVEGGRVEQVDRGPAVEPVARVGGDALGAGQGDQVRDEALLDRVMDLGQAHHLHVAPPLREGGTRQFRRLPRQGVIDIDVPFGRGPARPGRPQRGARRDDQGPVGPGERAAQGLDGEPVLLAIGHEVREVMVERGVDHAVRPRRPRAQTPRVFETPPVHLDARGLQGPGPGVRPRQPEDPMARAQQFPHHGRAHEPGRARYENAHSDFPFLVPYPLDKWSWWTRSCKGIVKLPKWRRSPFLDITGDSLRLQGDWYLVAEGSHPPGRKPRADARRNRERILEVAKGAFTRSGAHASLDEIARQAGVGPGTLYRHFPTRDALLEAVYRTEVEKLATAEQQLARDMPPIEALRAWMLLFVAYMEAKTIIAPALHTAAGDHAKVVEASYNQIWGAIRALVRRAVQSGDIRGDLDPIDLLRALIGVAVVAPGPDWQQNGRRLVDILLAGSRPVP